MFAQTTTAPLLCLACWHPLHWHRNPESSCLPKLAKCQVATKANNIFHLRCLGFPGVGSSMSCLVKANLCDHDARHLLLLTSNAHALEVLFGAGLLVETDCEVLMGSHFSEDTTELRLIQQVNLSFCDPLSRSLSLGLSLPWNSRAVFLFLSFHSLILSLSHIFLFSFEVHLIPFFQLLCRSIECAWPCGLDERCLSQPLGIFESLYYMLNLKYAEVRRVSVCWVGSPTTIFLKGTLTKSLSPHTYTHLSIYMYPHPRTHAHSCLLSSFFSLSSLSLSLCVSLTHTAFTYLKTRVICPNALLSFDSNACLLRQTCAINLTRMLRSSEDNPAL